MKYFAKKELDNSFGGWYTPEIHNDMFEIITHTKKETTTKEVDEWNEELGINVPKMINEEIEVVDYIEYKPKFECVEISEEEYNKLMSNIKGELRFNELGKLIDYVKKPKPSGMANAEYNYKTETWVEKATKNEQLEYLKQEILKNTKELSIYKEAGFSNDELQKKIDALVEKHRILSEDIAREDNKLY